MRQIALDTETTGLSHEQGHRVIEIGCIELVDRKFTGQHFHVYLNPEREVDPGAFKVHGISQQFLKDKPLFKDICHDLIAFIDQAELIIHNAPFDVGFLNAELKQINHPQSLAHYCQILDTLILAREKHPGQRNTLDALCKRYYVDNSNRELHGALLDAEILAFVYLAMTGGQTNLFENQEHFSENSQQSVDNRTRSLSSTSPVYFANEEELKRHQAFINKYQNQP